MNTSRIFHVLAAAATAVPFHRPSLRAVDPGAIDFGHDGPDAARMEAELHDLLLRRRDELDRTGPGAQR